MILGTVKEETYYSDITKTNRRMLVYVPKTDKKLPVLYLMHGISQTEDDWNNMCNASEILDRNINNGFAKPMIAVMVNGRADIDDGRPEDKFGLRNVRAFMNFETEFIHSVIPYIDTKYNTVAGRESRAVAGFSMGGYQSVNFGLSNLDKFSYIGGFSPAPAADAKNCALDFLRANGYKEKDLQRFINLMLITNGTEENGGDGIFGNFYEYSKRIYNYLKPLGVNCEHRFYPGGHEACVWSKSLEDFIKMIF